MVVKIDASPLLFLFFFFFLPLFFSFLFFHPLTFLVGGVFLHIQGLFFLLFSYIPHIFFHLFFANHTWLHIGLSLSLDTPPPLFFWSTDYFNYKLGKIYLVTFLYIYTPHSHIV